MQDLLRRTHGDTAAALREIAPTGEVVDLGEELLDDPARYYYAYDGHLNAEGAHLVAQALIREHEARGDG